MSTLSKLAASFAILLLNRVRLGTEDDRVEPDGLRTRLAHQAKLLRFQALEECREDSNLVSFMILANVTLNLFNVPHGNYKMYNFIYFYIKLYYILKL